MEALASRCHVSKVRQSSIGPEVNRVIQARRSGLETWMPNAVFADQWCLEMETAAVSPQARKCNQAWVTGRA